MFNARMLGKTNLRIYFIPYEDALCFLNWARGTPDFVSVPELPQCVPPDAEIVAVQNEYNRAGFAVIVSHPSFPEVVPGDEIPREPGATRLITRRIKLEPVA